MTTTPNPPVNSSNNTETREEKTKRHSRTHSSRSSRRNSRNSPSTATTTPPASPASFSSTKKKDNSSSNIEAEDQNKHTNNKNSSNNTITNGNETISAGVNKKNFNDLDNSELEKNLAKTLAEFYRGGGEDYILNGEDEDIWEEPEKKRRLPIKADHYEYEEDLDEYNDGFTNRRACALYDFRAADESELSFNEGDILVIKYQQSKDWFFAELLVDEDDNSKASSGLVPENYLKLLGDETENIEG
ncbi:6856_t:CDS:2 [Ambispora leptoticha]|uniref:6856_t:CDS:1 n=1 Tax=Ambispora leptoticha TaxID=144679 RepID=A0A9N8VHK4_9GLOM|nr:6856_t:CDS:2 [Ambispora leptoticha]